VAYKSGKIIDGHGYVDILVSPDGKVPGQKYSALVDTGFSGFISLPIIAATLLGLKAHTTARYQLANGKLSEPVPLAYAFGCLDGDSFVQGLVCLSEYSSAVIGVDFLQRSGKVVFLGSKNIGIGMVDEADLLAAVKAAKPQKKV
jgi:predicted aspartyl protease